MNNLLKGLLSFFLLFSLFVSAQSSVAQEPGHPLNPVIQKAMEVNNRNFKRIYNELTYTYTTHQNIVVTDGKGNIVYQDDSVYNISYGGSPEQKKIEEASASTSVNKPGVAEKEKKSRESATRTFVVNYIPPFSDEAARYYRYKLDGETTLEDGEKVWVIIFYPVTYNKSLMIGRVYVDQADYHMVKYVATPLVSPPFVEKGSGTQYFTKMTIKTAKGPEEIWVFTRVELTGTLRFLFWTFNGRAILDQRDYVFEK